jgi:hypothetical protein
MTTGWPQNQQDLRWPHSDANDAGPGSQAGGRVATDSDHSAASGAGFGEEHPSGPLPVTRSPQPRGRLGRGKSRSGGRQTSGPDDGPSDADYDWIRYLGEAGPAQDHSKGPAETRPSSAEDDSSSGRSAGRLRSRRHAAPEQLSADTDAGPAAATGRAGRRGRATQADDFSAPDVVAPRPLGRPTEPATESWTSGLSRPLTSRPETSRPGTSRHGRTQPDAASTSA